MSNSKNTTQPHHYEMHISFDECDPAGILFFGHIFRLAHRAFERFVEEIGIPYDDWFASPLWGAPIRHAEVNFFNPLRLGNAATAELALKKIGQHSLVMQYRFYKDKELAAEVETVHVFIDRATGKARPIPDEFSAKLNSAF